MPRRRHIATLITLAIAPIALGAEVVVSPSNLNGWTLHSTDSSAIVGTGSATAEFVNGPATPPLGTGSAHLQTGSGAGDGSAQLRTGNFAGTRIADITALSYSTFITSWNGQQAPYLTIWLDIDGNGSRDDRLWFEPDYSSAGAGNGNPSPQPAPVLNTWQTWDALGGMWYSDNVAGPGSNAITLSDYLATPGYANATIIDDAFQSIGGFRIASGFGSDSDSFNANVDNLTFATASGSTTYNFELTGAAPVPTPAAAAAGLALLASLAASRRTRAAIH